jgi:hypothetical protein
MIQIGSAAIYFDWAHNVGRTGIPRPSNESQLDLCLPSCGRVLWDGSPFIRAASRVDL